MDVPHLRAGMEAGGGASMATPRPTATAQNKSTLAGHEASWLGELDLTWPTGRSLPQESGNRLHIPAGCGSRLHAAVLHRGCFLLLSAPL